jgi:hypothetical protein
LAGSTGVNNYSTWTNTNTGQNYYDGTGTAPYHGGAAIQAVAQTNGNFGLYFGNYTATSVSSGFTVAGSTDGVLNVSGTLSNTSNYGTTIISQTVTLTAGRTYLLDFWTSGEDATDTRFARDGIFRTQIIGPTTTYDFYFGAPGGQNVDATGTADTVGTSQRYKINFTASTTGSYTFDWQSWGHINLGGLTPNWSYGNVETSELVLDDVILNDVTPEPSTWAAGLAILLLTLIPLWKRFKRSAHTPVRSSITKALRMKSLSIVAAL